MANQEQDPARVALRKATSIGKATPQPNPVLDWIARQGDKIVGTAEMGAGLFDGNPGPEMLKAISVLPPALAKRFGAELLQKLKDSGQWSDEMISAFTAAQQRYPRLFGHVRAVRPPLNPLENVSGVQGAGWRGAITEGVPTSPGRRTTANPGWKDVIPMLTPEKRVQASMNTSTLGFKNADGWNIANNPTSTVHHELAHAAQQLRRGGEFEDSYRAADDLVGYRNNPYEVRARQAGAKAVLRDPASKTDKRMATPFTIASKVGPKDITLTEGEAMIERVFKEYIRELRAHSGEVTPRATELYEKLRRLGSGSRTLEVEQRGLNIFDK